MIRNCHGDMGFMEAMVSSISVMTVLCVYLVFVASNIGAFYDPLEDFDPRSIELETVDGITYSEPYLYSYMEYKALKGILVDVSVLGFSEEPFSIGLGQDEGMEFTRDYVLILDYDNGRKVPVKVEVTAFA